VSIDLSKVRKSNLLVKGKSCCDDLKGPGKKGLTGEKTIDTKVSRKNNKGNGGAIAGYKFDISGADALDNVSDFEKKGNIDEGYKNWGGRKVEMGYAGFPFRDK